MRINGCRPMPARRTELIHAGLRGLLAAMAMTGARTVSAGIAGKEKSPPEAIVARHEPRILKRQPEHRRSAITELIHWAYGSGGGVMFGLLPAVVRRHPFSGPAYGLLFWLGYQVAIAPLLDVERTQERRVLWPTLVAADHVLYGVVVAGRSRSTTEDA